MCKYYGNVHNQKRILSLFVISTKMQTPSIDCDLCGVVVRECIRVPHFDSMGLLLMNKTFCKDCWDCWRNKRLNLDGKNLYGVQVMTCPHCQKPLSDENYHHTTVPPHRYTVVVNTHSVMVTAYTKLETFKRDILWSVSYNDIEEFDLQVDGVIVHRLYLNTSAGTVIDIVKRPNTLNISIQIYPCAEPFAIDVYETSIFAALKGFFSKLDPILFDVRTGIEFIDTRLISSYEDLDIIAVMPRQLPATLCFSS